MDIADKLIEVEDVPGGGVRVFFRLDGLKIFTGWAGHRERVLPEAERLKTAIRALDNRPRVAVCVLIVNDEGKVLLGEKIGGEEDGHWEFPGGKVEAGETLRQAAAREVMEETGVFIGTPKALGTIDRYVDNAHWVTTFMTARYIGGVPEIKEPAKIRRWGWYELRSLPHPLRAGIPILLQEFSKEVVQAVGRPLL